MKKTFPLHAPDKTDARILDAIKHDVRKYVKRERNKTPPEGFGGWSFTCRVGKDEASAQATPLKDVSAAIDSVAQAGAPAAFVEVHAVPARPESAE